MLEVFGQLSVEDWKSFSLAVSGFRSGVLLCWSLTLVLVRSSWAWSVAGLSLSAVAFVGVGLLPGFVDAGPARRPSPPGVPCGRSIPVRAKKEITESAAGSRVTTSASVGAGRLCRMQSLPRGARRWCGNHPVRPGRMAVVRRPGDHALDKAAHAGTSAAHQLERARPKFYKNCICQMFHFCLLFI